MALIVQTASVSESKNTKDQVYLVDSIAPAPAFGISVVLNAVDSYRQNEINSDITQLRDLVLELGLTEGSVVSSISKPIGSAKSAYTVGAVGGIGTVSIEMGSQFVGGFGTEIFTQLVACCRNALNDNYLKSL